MPPGGSMCPNVFGYFYSVKNDKIGKGFTITGTSEKMNADFGHLRILEFFKCTFD